MHWLNKTKERKLWELGRLPIYLRKRLPSCQEPPVANSRTRTGELTKPLQWL